MLDDTFFQFVIGGETRCTGHQWRLWTAVRAFIRAAEGPADFID
jgi:hypothetical protein